LKKKEMFVDGRWKELRGTLQKGLSPIGWQKGKNKVGGEKKSLLRPETRAIDLAREKPPILEE